MTTKRRMFLVVVLPLTSLSGCLEGTSSNEDTSGDDSSNEDTSSDDLPNEDTSGEELDVTDIEIVNTQSESIEVSVTATTDNRTEFGETVNIKQGENKMFDNPLKDGTNYTLTVTVNETLRDEYNWSPETRDNTGIRVIIDESEMNFQEIVS